MPVTVGTVASVAQAGYGLFKEISGSEKLKKLLTQRKSYTTPAEIMKILNLALSQGGGDTTTRDYETGQVKQETSAAIHAALRLGANPNDLSSLFQQSVGRMLQIGDQFHKSNMESFSKIMEGYNLVAENKTAEWKTQQDIIKDQMQAAAGKTASGTQDLNNAVNSIIAILSSNKTSDLFKTGAEAMLPSP